MYTSYFDNLGNVTFPVVSIARRPPEWYSGPEFRRLAPTDQLLQRHADGPLTDEQYTRIYTESVLDWLSASDTWERLVRTYGTNVILLGHEQPGVFSPRRVVAAWFSNALGVNVPEIGYHLLPDFPA